MSTDTRGLGLAVFFFVFGLLPYWSKVHKHLSEVLGCWALTFPNVGWISALRLLGDIFHLEGFYVAHLFFVVLMCTTWAILAVLTAMAFWRGKILFAAPEDVLRDTRHWGKHKEEDVEKDAGHQ